jgi:hypothetical protein
MDELCIHEMDPATCTICKHGVQRRPAEASAARAELRGDR